MLDSYVEAEKFLEGRRGIQVAIYNSNLKRYIFGHYDDELTRQNNKNQTNGNCNVVAEISNGPVVAVNSIKSEPVDLLNTDNVLEASGDSNENLDISVDSQREYLLQISFSDQDEINDTSENGARAECGTNLAESVDTAHNYVDEMRGITNSETPIGNTNDLFTDLTPIQVKEEPKISFLNLPDDILEISGDEFDALREEIAYGSDGDDSFDELRKEFDNLLAKGIDLPDPIKEEPVDMLKHCDVMPSATERICAEYPNSEIDDSFDPVLGNMPRLINVSKNQFNIIFKSRRKSNIFFCRN